MNTPMRTSLSSIEIRFRTPLRVTCALLALGCASLLVAEDQHTSPDLTVHEWGTFTAVAGKGGSAIEWVPLTGPTDLPGFVEHFSDINYKVWSSGDDSNGDASFVLLLRAGRVRVGSGVVREGSLHGMVSPRSAF